MCVLVCMMLSWPAALLHGPIHAPRNGTSCLSVPGRCSRDALSCWIHPSMRPPVPMNPPVLTQYTYPAHLHFPREKNTHPPTPQVDATTALMSVCAHHTPHLHLFLRVFLLFVCLCWQGGGLVVSVVYSIGVCVCVYVPLCSGICAYFCLYLCFLRVAVCVCVSVVVCACVCVWW